MSNYKIAIIALNIITDWPTVRWDFSESIKNGLGKNFFSVLYLSKYALPVIRQWFLAHNSDLDRALVCDNLSEI